MFNCFSRSALNPENPARLPWINVNKAGKRFMNEAYPFVQDSAYRPFEVMDCDFYNTRSGVPEFPNIPCYLILDETGRKRGPIQERNSAEVFVGAKVCVIQSISEARGPTQRRGVG